MSNIKFTLNGKDLNLPNGFVEPIYLRVKFRFTKRNVKMRLSKSQRNYLKQISRVISKL